MPQLSILIPARNEMFLSRTVDDLLANIEGDTEIIIGLDGQWADPPIVDNPRVKILYYPKSIGQRAMTNQLCRLSTAKYVMKVDAHCAFDKGFDVKMMADMQDDWTMAPLMRNLHAFDWVCADGHRRYQGPSGPCIGCGLETKRDIIWYAKPNPRSCSYRFDRDLHFQYFNEYKSRQEGELVESMSLQGSCFMMTRAKYWELDICDENHGSWGQQGTEVACKTWLSGGRVIVNKKTWYAHLFRTQGGDFGFPYPQDSQQVDHSRKYSKGLFLEGKWDKAIYPLQWLVDKFAPVPGWHDMTVPKTNKGIIFYTDHSVRVKIAGKVQKQLNKISKEKGIPIVSASQKPMPHFGVKNVVVKKETENLNIVGKSWLTYFKQILAALEASDAEIIFFCEHDNLYHPSHFDFVPLKKDVFYYDRAWWKIHEDGLAVRWDADQVSGLCCYREIALKYYRNKVANFNHATFDRKFEPMSGVGSEWWKAKYPSLDIRHDKNLTKNKRSMADFRNKDSASSFESATFDKIPGWDADEIKSIYK